MRLIIFTCGYLFTSRICPPNAFTVLILDRTSSATAPAAAYFSCSRAVDVAPNCYKFVDSVLSVLSKVDLIYW